MTKTKAKTGPKKPQRFTLARRQKYLGLLAKGVRRMKAAKACGVHYNTVLNHVAADPDFAAEVELAELAAVDEVESDLFKACHEDRNVTAIIFFLQNRAPDRWQDRRNVNLSGSIGVGITDEKIDAELHRLLESRGANRTVEVESKSKADHGNGNGKA